MQLAGFPNILAFYGAKVFIRRQLLVSGLRSRTHAYTLSGCRASITPPGYIGALGRTRTHISIRNMLYRHTEIPFLHLTHV